jgi:hypothetical protein
LDEELVESDVIRSILGKEEISFLHQIFAFIVKSIGTGSTSK